MNKNSYEKIVQLLNSQNIAYREVEHPPMYTSDQEEEMTGLPVEQGAKSLLIKAGDQFVLVVLPGNARLSTEKVKQFLGVKKVRFAKEEEVEKLMGCEIGACYPLGNITGIGTYMDPQLLEYKEVAFNPGLHTKTIILNPTDLVHVAKINLTEISER